MGKGLRYDGAVSEGEDPSYGLLWASVEEAWDDDKRHTAFIAYCQERGNLAEAAKRYRPVAEAEAPLDDAGAEARREVAKKRLAAITALAFATLDSEKTKVDTAGSQRAIRIVAFLMLLAAVVGLVYGLSLGRR